MTPLLDLVRRHADANAGDEGIALMPIRGLFAVRATTPSGLKHDISRPLVCLVLQGAKRVTVGAQPYDSPRGIRCSSLPMCRPSVRLRAPACPPHTIRWYSNSTPR